MSDLREKINGLVMVAADCFASPSQGDIERCGKVTDRILALLPKAPDAGISWGGFNLSGDSPSIAEVRRLIQVEIRAEGLQQAVISLNAQVQKVAKLRWDGNYLYVGDFKLGSMHYHLHSETWSIRLLIDGYDSKRAESYKEARAAVEAAVRKALWWSE